MKQRGIHQSILKAILDEYSQTTQTVTDIVAKDPAALRRRCWGPGKPQEAYTEQVSFSDAMPDTMLGYFYALIAMACMYSDSLGVAKHHDVQADLSAGSTAKCGAYTQTRGCAG